MRPPSVPSRPLALFAALATAATLGLMPPAQAEPLHAPLVFAPGSKVSLAGDSTLHKFSAETTDLRGTREATAGSRATSLEALARAQQLKSLTLTIRVGTLQSGEGALDKAIWKTLRATEFPTLTFTLDRYTLVGAAEGSAFTVDAVGRLSIAGVEKPVRLKVHAFPGAGGLLRLIGDAPLRMTDFGIKPPSFMGGMMKTRDEVAVHFDVKVAGPAKPAG